MWLCVNFQQGVILSSGAEKVGAAFYSLDECKHEVSPVVSEAAVKF